MAELNACCSSDAQATCCEPSDKPVCCDSTAHTAGTCGCSAGQSTVTTDVREAVRARYAAAAEAATGGSCCGDGAAVITDDQADVFGRWLYPDGDRAELPDSAVMASLGCGNPTAVAELRAGETVLDLGSGGGIDVLLSARRVGPTGKAYGLDMTDEMLALARENQAGGRFAVSDVIADPDMDADTRADMQRWTGCIAGALTREEFTWVLTDAGLVDVEIEETHRVHASAASAIVRARKT